MRSGWGSAMPDGGARPAWLDRDALAAMICVPVHHVARLVKAGKLPAPSYHLGPRSPRWRGDDIDAMLAGTITSSGAAGLAQAIRENSRPRRPQAA